MKNTLSILLLVAGLSASAQSEILPTHKLVLETTVLQSTIEEFEMITKIIANSPTIRHMRDGNMDLVMFHTPMKDSVVVRFTSNTSDEIYRLYVAR
jgi:hypothetical protein